MFPFFMLIKHLVNGELSHQHQDSSFSNSEMVKYSCFDATYVFDIIGRNSMLWYKNSFIWHLMWSSFYFRHFIQLQPNAANFSISMNKSLFRSFYAVLIRLHSLSMIISELFHDNTLSKVLLNKLSYLCITRNIVSMCERLAAF